jgi:beta-glucosidase
MNGLLHRFPVGFHWGAATSAHQVEGGNDKNDWWRFEQVPGRIHGGDRSGAACGHYQRFDEDFGLASADGHNAHRLSFEWSRIMPERGRVDPAAVAHYHAVLESLERHGLRPLVTLHHFTNPVWIADRGGWENRETVQHYCAFVRFCAREFGSEVDWWCTVNEPEVYAFRGWSEGVWPPAKRDESAALCVMANLLEAHGLAYRILHEHDRGGAEGRGRTAHVGFAKHLPQLEGDRWWFPLDGLRAGFENAVFNDAVLEAAVTGEIRLTIPGARGVTRHVPELKGSLDYVGLNYYTRWKVRMFAPDPHVAKGGAPRTDLGWEIYPQGFERAVMRVAKLKLPVLVTEHGFADALDKFRPRALVQSLEHLGRAIDRGANVIGYYHWSLLDNFEWSDGYSGRFGLYQVDFADPALPRNRTKSADLYSRIARANAIEQEVATEAGIAR